MGREMRPAPRALWRESGAVLFTAFNWMAHWFDPGISSGSSREMGAGFLVLFMDGLGTGEPGRKKSGEKEDGKQSIRSGGIRGFACCFALRGFRNRFF